MVSSREFVNFVFSLSVSLSLSLCLSLSLSLSLSVSLSLSLSLSYLSSLAQSVTFSATPSVLRVYRRPAVFLLNTPPTSLRLCVGIKPAHPRCRSKRPRVTCVWRDGWSSPGALVTKLLMACVCNVFPNRCLSFQKHVNCFPIVARHRQHFWWFSVKFHGHQNFLFYVHHVAKSIGAPPSNERFDYFSNLHECKS